MSTRGVGMVVARAVSDVEFREGLFHRTAEVLSGFDLSSMEIDALKNLKESKLNEFCLNLVATGFK